MLNVPISWLLSSTTGLQKYTFKISQNLPGPVFTGSEGLKCPNAGCDHKNWTTRPISNPSRKSFVYQRFVSISSYYICYDLLVSITIALIDTNFLLIYLFSADIKQISWVQQISAMASRFHIAYTQPWQLKQVQKLESLTKQRNQVCLFTTTWTWIVQSVYDLLFFILLFSLTSYSAKLHLFNNFSISTGFSVINLVLRHPSGQGTFPENHHLWSISAPMGLNATTTICKLLIVVTHANTVCSTGSHLQTRGVEDLSISYDNLDRLRNVILPPLVMPHICSWETWDWYWLEPQMRIWRCNSKVCSKAYSLPFSCVPNSSVSVSAVEITSDCVEVSIPVLLCVRKGLMIIFKH